MSVVQTCCLPLYSSAPSSERLNVFWIPCWTLQSSFKETYIESLLNANNNPPDWSCNTQVRNPGFSLRPGSVALGAGGLPLSSHLHLLLLVEVQGGSGHRLETLEFFAQAHTKLLGAPRFKKKKKSRKKIYSLWWLGARWKGESKKDRGKPSHCKLHLFSYNNLPGDSLYLARIWLPVAGLRP